MQYIATILLLINLHISYSQSDNKIVIIDDVPTKLQKDSWRSAVPKTDIDTVYVMDSTTAIKKYGEYIGNHGLIFVKTYSETAVVKYNIERLNYGDGNPLVFVDGEEIPYEEMNSIIPSDVEHFQILKRLEEVNLKKNGPQAINGIVLIKMKRP